MDRQVHGRLIHVHLYKQHTTAKLVGWLVLSYPEH